MSIPHNELWECAKTLARQSVCRCQEENASRQDAIAEAVAKERRRCELLVVRWPQTHKTDGRCNGTLCDIANAIRDGCI